MKKKLKALSENKLVKDYSFTLLFSGLNALASFGIFKLVFNEYGEDDFYRFSLFKRMVGFILPISLLGLAVSLSKSVSKNVENKKRHSSLLIISLIWSLLLPILGIVSLMLFPSSISTLLWNEQTQYDIEISYSLIFYTLSLVLGTLVYSVFRGQMRYKAASVLEFFNLSVLPVTCVLIGSSLIQAISLMALGVVLLNFVLAIFIIAKNNFVLLKFRQDSRELLAFGLPRLPGDFAFYFLLALPAFIGLRLYSMEISGVVSFGISLLALTQVLLQPVGVISLTRAVHLIHTNKVNILKKETWGTFKVMLVVSFGLLACEYLFLDIFIELFFDPSFLKHSYIFRIMLFAIPFLTIFYSLRGILDAFYHNPVVGNISMISILFFSACSVLINYLNLELEYFLFAFLLSLFLLSTLSIVYTRKAFKSL